MKRMKKLLVIVLALALVLPGLLMPASAASNRTSFPDVKPGEWYYPYVTQLAQVGGVHGLPDGTFKPLTPITRAEVATIAVNLFPPDHFIDTYCPPYIYRAYKGNVEKGMGANFWAKDAILKTYLCIAETAESMNSVINLRTWDQPATRTDIAVILTRVYLRYMNDLGKIDLPIEVPEDTPWLIGDFEKIVDTDAVMDIAWLYSEGIITGTNSRGDFNPQGTATRAEVCKIAVNLLDPSKRDKVDWNNIQPGGNTGNTGSDGPRYEKDFTGMDRVRNVQDVAFDYCRALEKEIGIQIFYIPYEWTENPEGLFSSDMAYAAIMAHGPDNFFRAVLAELKTMKAAYDKYPAGFLKEMAQKKGNRTAEIILCPYVLENIPGLQYHGRYEYGYSSTVDQLYLTGSGDTHYYSHEMGHMVYSAAAIRNGWNATESAWENMRRTGDMGSYISTRAIDTQQEDQAEVWAYMWEEPQTVIQACSNAGLRAKVQYFTQILDKNYSTFHSSQVPWASVLK